MENEVEQVYFEPAQRWQRTTSIKELSAALAVAQGHIENALKDSANPFFKSKYADLASVREAVRKPFAENGLAVIQMPSSDGAVVTLTTILTHSSGEWISSDLTMTAKDNSPQAIGSCITYARRYALQSFAGVAPEDDDAETAQGRPQRPVNGKWATNGKAEAATNAASEPEPEIPVSDEAASAASNARKQHAHMIEQFARVKTAIGPKAFVRILAAHGYEDVTEIRSIEIGRKVYTDMAKELEQQVNAGAAK